MMDIGTETVLNPGLAKPTGMARRVLVFAPHPDDEVFGCGGTLCLLAEAGAMVSVVIVSDGALGGVGDTLIVEREAECKAAANLLGYPPPTFWRLPDRGLRYGEALVTRMLSAIAAADADLIFAPAITEIHPDHQAVALAAAEALRRLGGERRLALYEISAPLLPNTLVDITAVEARKLEAMRCFGSQLTEQPYDGRIAALNRYRAYHLGPEVTAAEAFTITDAAGLEQGFAPLFESALARRRRLGYAIDGADLPLVSVIVRSMDRPTLIEALNSVAAQTYPNIEVVLVNALGGRHSAVVAGPYPVRLVDHGGPLRRSRAANAGLEAAQGELLIFLDDDDWFEPSHIADLVAKLGRNKSAVACYAGVRCVRDAGGNSETVRVYDELYDPTRLLVENYIPIHALLFRRSALQGNRACRFDEAIDLFEDWDFLLQLLQHGEFARQEGISAGYRIHAGSGQGVSADEQQGVAALEYILAKWHPRWSIAQVRDLVARTRLSGRLLQDANAALETSNAELEKSKDANTLAEQHLQTSEAERVRLERQLRNSERERLIMLQSRSWRITAPMRRVSAWLLSLKAARARLRWREFVLRALSACYRSALLAPVRGIVPVSVKRRLRDFFSRSHSPREVPVFSGRLSDLPLVSIIIPVYKHAEYLRQCVSSALAQSYANVEVVVIDDASPDPRVREILSEFETDPRARIMPNEINLGISLTQNRALQESKGEIIAFLDCDDFLAADAVETCLRYWKEETVYSHSGRINVDKNGKEVSRIGFEHLPRQDYFAENLEAMYATHFKMIRRDVFARIGLFDPRFDTAQDYDMLMRIAFHYATERFAYVPHFVYSHRLHERQATETAQNRQSQAVATVQQEARLRRNIRDGKFDKRLSFIMLSFGKHTQTLDAIRSLERTVRVPHEIILFDNGSDPETVAFLKANIDGKFANVRVYYSERNLGPADGRRVALEKARGDWFVIFDNDEIAEEGWIEEMLVRACSDPKIGAVTSKVIFPDRSLQCCGGFIEPVEGEVIRLQLYGRGLDSYDLNTAEFRDCDWCPIGATLFTVNPGPFLHAGYPNIFEDAGVSMAMRRQGYRLVNSPGSWVWHEHVTYRKHVEMGARYTRERYDPKRMLVSLASFYRENGLIIEDEYVWRENRLTEMSLASVRTLLEKLARDTYPEPSGPLMPEEVIVAQARNQRMES